MFPIPEASGFPQPIAMASPLRGTDHSRRFTHQVGQLLQGSTLGVWLRCFIESAEALWIADDDPFCPELVQFFAKYRDVRDPKAHGNPINRLLSFRNSLMHGNY